MKHKRRYKVKHDGETEKKKVKGQNKGSQAAKYFHYLQAEM